MTPFLHHIAQTFYSEYGNELYKHTFVFPNKRAGVFFQKYLAEIAGKPVFSPKIITIQELFQSLSKYRIADKIEMLVMLYGQFTETGKSDELFDDFVYWGEMLLNDFNDVDKHMVDAKQLFRNIHNLKSMDDEMSYLTDEQVKAIQRFWSNFMPYEGNETKREFLETWEILFELYSSFRDALNAKGYAYEGMLFREVADRAKRKEDIELPFSDIVFVGLNALTPTEIELMKYLKNRDIADFYWDYDSPLVRDKKNRASLWVQENLTMFPSKLELKTDIPLSCGEGAGERPKPQVKLIGIPSGVGQAKIMNQLLTQLLNKKNISEPNAGLNTAIVLPDENLLLPVLYSIPQEIEKINVTMGYSLQHSSVASLIENIALLHHNVRETDGEAAFYFRFVLSVLNHPLVTMVAKAETDALKAYIQQYNRVVLTVSELATHPFLSLIFSPVSDWTQIGEYLKSILSEVYKQLTSGRNTENDTRSIDLEREFIVQYYKSITRLQETLLSAQNMSIETYFRLLKRLAQSISVSFSGEPLSGLQVMGVLETRVIDFENLIILSMNEGVFPLKNPTNSFIPYTLRKGFGLPTYEHQDSTYAYHFYRMISRAKRVFMLYDTRTEEMQTGEVSRYFYQLRYLYSNHFCIEKSVVSYDVSAPEIQPVSVQKTPEVMRKLQKFRAGGDAYLSASLINNYINCPLQFYFAAVEGLSEDKEVQESVEADVFGTIYHAIMQEIYNRHKGKPVLPDTLKSIAENDKYLTDLIEQAFAEHYFKQRDKRRALTGHHYLIGEILRDYVKQTLKFDAQFTPFEYVDSEYRFKSVHQISDELSINIKGSIDRIDKSNNNIRIIDYKSGKGDLNFKSIEQLFDSSKANRPYQILQVFVYALFYNSTLPISPTIYYLRNIFTEHNPTITFSGEPITDISGYLPDFTEKLNAVLQEIFDKNVSFSQTQNEKNCEWCAFKDVCRR
ncbi:PD-(D/E)XK nuclease family protein [Petrimonas sp.]|uniref:PD-(D/E)XK nuclease family protein n=1 Tax=Petrimonas sp. TaxID=2023866 RepID=UPI003F517033